MEEGCFSGLVASSSPGAWQAPLPLGPGSLPSLLSSRTVRENFYLTRTFFPCYSSWTDNSEDRGTSSWFSSSTQGQKVRDDGNSNAIGHIIVVLFWCCRMQIPELSFFSDSVIIGQRVCLWRIPTASHGSQSISIPPFSLSLPLSFSLPLPLLASSLPITPLFPLSLRIVPLSPLFHFSLPLWFFIYFLGIGIHSCGSKCEKNSCPSPTPISQPPSSLLGRIDCKYKRTHIYFPWFLHKWLCAMHTVWYFDFLTYLLEIVPY